MDQNEYRMMTKKGVFVEERACDHPDAGRYPYSLSHEVCTKCGQIVSKPVDAMSVDPSIPWRKS